MTKMGVDPEQLKAPQPQPAGWYKLKFVGFKPTAGKKDPNSVNYNGTFEVLNPATPSPTGQPVRMYATMSNKMPRHINDIVHGLGFSLEPDGELPGQWIADPAAPDDVTKMQYKGPLLGKTMEAELAETEYNGNKRNELRQVRCNVPGCAQKHPDIRHQTDMIGKKKP
jgi:hypothetical protein